MQTGTQSENVENGFVSFARRLVAVPHSEIKAKLDAEKEAKEAAKASASRASASSSKNHS